MRTQKGITLISMIVIIMLLLILAVVAINSIENDEIISQTNSMTEGFNELQKDELSKLNNLYTDIIEDFNPNGTEDGTDDSGDQEVVPDEPECTHDLRDDYRYIGYRMHELFRVCTKCDYENEIEVQESCIYNVEVADGLCVKCKNPCEHSMDIMTQQCQWCGFGCEHDYEDWYVPYADNHWIYKKCNDCEYILETGEVESCDFDGDGSCSKCGQSCCDIGRKKYDYEYIEDGEHKVFIECDYCSGNKEEKIEKCSFSITDNNEMKCADCDHICEHLRWNADNQCEICGKQFYEDGV